MEDIKIIERLRAIYNSPKLSCKREIALLIDELQGEKK
jgi:hypothetical protein